ncbi:MAG: WYL domain-containing transcriptional regulator [Deltaproteobacteria bacterium]|nr:WYL domain-containing transcriptional regulator [Deltaproteobacteria bacterium]
MSNLERKIALWRKLAGRKEGYRIKELSDALGVSKNTIQRDIDALSRCGLPVREEREGQALRYWIEPGGIPVAQLTQLELGSLDAASAALKPFDLTPIYGNYESGRAKVSPRSNGAAFETSEPVGPRVTLSVYEPLLQGILGSRRCRIRYTPRTEKEPREYEVEPYQFFLAYGVTYLRARVPPHAGRAQFLMHRISEATLTDRVFERKALKTTAFRVWESEPEDVEVVFSPNIAPLIAERSWHRTQKLEHQPDGSLVFKASLSGKSEFVGWVMSWAPWAELVKPEAWRKELLDRAGQAAETHKLRPCG